MPPVFQESSPSEELSETEGLETDPAVPQDGPAASETPSSLEDAEVPFAEANPMTAAEESSPSEELSETEAFLVEEIGLTQKQMRKIRTFWSYSGDRLPPLTRCQMIADYLQNDVGLNQDQLCRTIADCPEALEVFSVETLKEKVRFLEVEVGVEEPDLPEVVAAYPQVLSRPILTTLRPALEFWMGPANVDPEELPALLKKHAMQMWMRPEALQLKLRFAKEVMGLSLAKVLACSTPFFRLSMEKTVAPRHFFSIQRKVTGLSLEDKVGGSDAAFCKKIGAKPAEYKDFLEQWPFSDQARALAWLQPPKKKRFRSNWSGPSSQNKFKKRNFQKKRSFRKQNYDDEPRSNFDKSQSRSRRPQRPRPDFDESRFEADRSDLFSRAEL